MPPSAPHSVAFPSAPHSCSCLLVFCAQDEIGRVVEVCCDICAHALSHHGEAVRPKLHALAVLRSLARIVADAEQTKDMEVAVRALLCAGLMFPDGGEGAPSSAENLRAFAGEPGTVAGIVRLCRQQDADVFVVARTILQEMMADKQLVDKVEEELQAAAFDVRKLRESLQATPEAAAADLN